MTEAGVRRVSLPTRSEGSHKSRLSGKRLTAHVIMERPMKLTKYFEGVKGIGVLATADAQSKVNVAIYARPHFLDQNDDSHCVFIMSDQASHDNVKANPHAAYLFVEEGADHEGKRLTLTMVREETDLEKIQAIRRRGVPLASEEGSKYLVHFRIDAVRPLIGAE